MKNASCRVSHFQKTALYTLKKSFCALFAILFTAGFALAETDELPVWSDYCPEKFVNAKKLSADEYAAQSYLKFIKPTEKRLGEYNQTVEYWQKRKEQFDYFMTICSNFSKEKQEACYVRVVEREERLNKVLEQQKKEKAKTSGWKEVEPQGPMQQMNNMLRMMTPNY